MILLRKRMKVNKGEERIPGACGWGQTREVEAIDFYRSLLARPRDLGYQPIIPRPTYLTERPRMSSREEMTREDILCVQLKFSIGTYNN
jgi:hypothetical protein